MNTLKTQILVSFSLQCSQLSYSPIAPTKLVVPILVKYHRNDYRDLCGRNFLISVIPSGKLFHSSSTSGGKLECSLYHFTPVIPVGKTFHSSENFITLPLRVVGRVVLGFAGRSAIHCDNKW
jgi:hypothetical protein